MYWNRQWITWMDGGQTQNIQTLTKQVNTAYMYIYMCTVTVDHVNEYYKFVSFLTVNLTN